MKQLVDFLNRVPGVRVLSSHADEEWWWVKLAIDVEHELAWRVVQELGHVLNYLSVNEKLPTVFKPVSPPPYMNGGPAQFLSWIIEARTAEIEPGRAAEWLEARLPDPVGEPEEWRMDDGDSGGP